MSKTSVILSPISRMQSVRGDKMTERTGIFAFIQSRMIDSLKHFVMDDEGSRMEIDAIILEHNRIIPVTDPEWMLDYIVAGTVVEMLEDVRNAYLDAVSNKRKAFLEHLEAGLTKMEKNYYDFGNKVRDTGVFNMDVLHDSMKDALSGTKDALIGE